MARANQELRTDNLSLPEELILMLLHEESGYFYKVTGWQLHCAFVGAVLAELSLLSRIDLDIDSLHLLDKKKTNNPILDILLKEIAKDPIQRSTVYWIERLAIHAESVIDLTLNRLVKMKILKRHEGDFWTLNTKSHHTNLIQNRISQCLFLDAIPEPKDAIIIALIYVCDVFRFIYELDDKTENRIEQISRIDLIGHSIASAVESTIASPSLRRPSLTKKIPTVPLHKILFNRHLRVGHIPALFAELTEQYGPAYQVCVPFQKPMVFLAGGNVNRWAHKNGRMYFRTKDYFTDIEKVYGASGLIPAVDGADHFRLRKAMQPGYSKKRIENQLDTLYSLIRRFMADWKEGSTLQAASMCRHMVNAQIAPLVLSIEAQDIMEDLISYKERALMTHVAKILPKFMLHTAGMKRAYKGVEAAIHRVEASHTPAQRINSSRDLADDLLSLHENDPLFLPESNMGFSLSAPILASMYLGDSLGFALYAMVSQPDLYARIASEADALFTNGDPKKSDFKNSAIDVTKRFIKECMRMYPIIPMSIRNVMNTCVVEGFELQVGARIHIVQTAAHYMSEFFPDPYTFDIDRYSPPRDEHRSFAYTPYGWGTHQCLGFNMMEFVLIIDVLMIAHYFNLELSPPDYVLGYNPVPSMSPNKKLKFQVVEQRREFPV